MRALALAALALASPALAKAPQASLAARPTRHVTFPVAYVTVLPVRAASSRLAAVLPSARALLQRQLRALNVVVAPEGQSRAAAETAMRAKGLSGLQVQLSLTPSAEGGVKASFLVMSYPEGALRGAWNVTASGPEAKLVEAVVPRVVRDAAEDLKLAVGG